MTAPRDRRSLREADHPNCAMFGALAIVAVVLGLLASFVIAAATVLGWLLFALETWP